MYTLYGKEGSCSMAVHVLLNELNQPVKFVPAFGEKGPNPEFLKANPVGQVPVLVVDNQPITEGAAIMSYLMDTHESKFLPKSGMARATALQWLAFANATMHPAYGRVFFLKQNLGADAANHPLMAAAVKKINALWAIVDARLATHAYVGGAAIGAADILLTVIANWTPNVPQPVHFGTHVQRLLKEVSQRPAYQKTLSEEKVEYKAAA